MDKIEVRGARTHNLKNINLVIPRDKLIVVTGLSGSGKSSLAFDTLYAEGQRRYVESLSAYARQFLSLMEKPDVDHIEGLSPAISIEQKSTSHNPRSTVGTITEIHDYLRLLFARVGEPRCPDHDVPLAAQTVSQMVDNVLSQPEGKRLMLPNARVLIHQPAIDQGFGKATEIEIQAKEMLRMREWLENTLAKHTGRDIEKIRKDIEVDTFLTAQEAKEYGIVDEVLEHRS